jgi:DNA transposition AAA+ family ATPase
MIIGETGCGKTYAVDTYCRENPEHIYRLTLSNMSSIYDVIDELTEKIGLSTAVRRQGKVIRVALKLRELAEKGLRPQIIMDEGENVKLPILGLWKALYDQLNKYCSIVIMGTPELPEILKSFCRRGKVGARQFARRVKAGTVTLKSIDRTYKAFFEDKNIDEGVRKHLLALCDNYGELNDFLEPVMRAADEDGVSLNEAFFRQYFGL